ncbi:hypothetical protein O181_061223 [Austropuccinia psidii MF-1]|uniref:Uncharacterized protein n=1 Tax=Austropuccinia psidii MF-1 TaxID=1389203 RepID=A0A9Q3EHQ2_9BASI|nr:hypothetical protein [Austropuccinia psidii MF-1]
MSPIHLRDLGFQRHQPEDREGLSRTRRPGRGHHGHSGRWQEIEGNHTHSAIHIPIQQKPQTRGLEGYGSSSELHQLLKGLFQWSMDKKRFKLAFHLEELGARFQKICLREIPFKDLMEITKGWNPTRQRTSVPERAHYDSFKLPRSRPNQISSHLTPFGHQQIIGQESPFFTIPGSFQKKTRIQGQKQDHLQPKEERFRPNDPEAVGFGEKSAQEPEVVLHNSRISSPLDRNITPTQIEHNVVTPESNLSSDALWLQMSQYAEKIQKQFTEIEKSHERMKKLTASLDKIVKALQEGHSQLSKDSEETKKRLNLLFEEKHHSKRDKNFLDQDRNKLFNVYNNMKP